MTERQVWMLTGAYVPWPLAMQSTWASRGLQVIPRASRRSPAVSLMGEIAVDVLVSIGRSIRVLMEVGMAWVTVTSKRAVSRPVANHIARQRLGIVKLHVRDRR